jgi:hypothetical protein
MAKCIVRIYVQYILAILAPPDACWIFQIRQWWNTKHDYRVLSPGGLELKDSIEMFQVLFGGGLNSLAILMISLAVGWQILVLQQENLVYISLMLSYITVPYVFYINWATYFYERQLNGQGKSLQGKAPPPPAAGKKKLPERGVPPWRHNQGNNKSTAEWKTSLVIFTPANLYLSL